MVAVVAIHLGGKNVDSDVIVGPSAELGLHSGYKHDRLPHRPPGQLVFSVAVPGQGRPWGKSRSSGLAVSRGHGRLYSVHTLMRSVPSVM